ncbi:hypothetical protein HJG60_009150 [Phyllostomus discolor]|uniref:Uncharacterized protein n=1 Tax=Phyllostomus discolor TaxID=89673 RepID=A0A834DFR6_9CHIR|nr:hypothetical protein HJG60_009150 [Phyllostomus discolor]
MASPPPLSPSLQTCSYDLRSTDEARFPGLYRGEPESAADLLELCLGHCGQFSSLTDRPGAPEEGNNLKAATRWRPKTGAEVKGTDGGWLGRTAGLPAPLLPCLVSLAPELVSCEVPSPRRACSLDPGVHLRVHHRHGATLAAERGICKCFYFQEASGMGADSPRNFPAADMVE